MVDMILIALCCASISFTVTVTSMFKKTREVISRAHPKLEEWIHCPWCFGHAVVFVFMLVSDTQIFMVSRWIVFDWLFTCFAITGIMGIIHYVLLRAYEPVAKMMLTRKLSKLNDTRLQDKTQTEEQPQGDTARENK